MNGRSQVFGDTTAVFGLKILQAALMFVTSVVVSRGLGPEGRGLYYTPLLAATTVIVFSHLGLDQANVFLFGSRRVSIERLIAQSGAVAIAAGTVGGILLIVLASLDLRFFDGVPPAFVVAAGLIVPFGVYAILATGLLTLSGRVAAPFIASTGVALAQLLALGVLALTGAFTPAFVFAVAAAAVVATSVVLSLMLTRGSPLLVWDGTLLRQSLAHSLILHLGMVLLFLHLRVDMFLVKTLMGTAPLGIYSLAVVLAESAMLLADSLGLALTPRQMEGSLRDAATIALTGVRTIALAGVLVVGGWALFGRELIQLTFGRAFLGVYLPLLVLLPGIVLLGMQRICGPTVLRAGRPWTLTAIEGAGFLVNVVLNLWWIRRAGLVGAAAASTVSYGLIAVSVLAWAGKLGETSIVAAVPRSADIRRVTAALRARWRTARMERSDV